MKRLHVHVHVPNLERAIGYYAALFGAEPTVTKPDYAKWMLDDPRVNFAISAGGAAAGLSHLGIQAESAEELESLAAQAKESGGALTEEKEARCCYARSDKYWSRDPAGIGWELFHTHEQIDEFGRSTVLPATEQKAVAAPGGCC